MACGDEISEDDRRGSSARLMSNPNIISIPFHNQTRQKMTATYQYQVMENDELDISFTQPGSNPIADHPKTMVHIHIYYCVVKY